MKELSDNIIEIHSIHRAVCRYYRISEKSIFMKHRRREETEIRMKFFWLSRKMTPLSLSRIGEYPKKFTGRVWDHASVLHSIKAIDDLCFTNKKIREDLEKLEDKARKIQETFEYELPLMKEDIMRAVINADSKTMLFTEINNIMNTYKK